MTGTGSQGSSGAGGEGTAPLGELSYAEASRELDAIVAYFEQRDVDVDQLVSRLERATALVGELDRRLRRTRVQVDQLVPKLSAVLAGTADANDDANDDANGAADELDEEHDAADELDEDEDEDDEDGDEDGTAVVATVEIEETQVMVAEIDGLGPDDIGDRAANGRRRRGEPPAEPSPGLF